MRPPITYALIPFLLGLSLCSTGIMTFGVFTSIATAIGIILWWRKKREKKYLIYRIWGGMIVGVAFVGICNQNSEVGIIKSTEGEISDVWKDMPPRELGVSVRIKEIKTIKSKKGNLFVLYRGLIIDVPVIRNDLMGKKVYWTESPKKNHEIICEGDTISLNGTIKHNTSISVLKDNTVKENKEDYYIYNERITLVEYEDDFFSYLRRKIYLSIIYDSEIESKYPGFVYALLMGNRSYLGLDQIQLFKETGTMHLFAVSGLHVGIVYLLCSFILRIIISSKRVCIIASLFFVFGYIALVGYASSACRAFIMITMWQSSILLYKKSNPISSLYWAAILILLIRPEALFSIGFQMSFTVVLNILSSLDRNLVRKSFNIYNVLRNTFIISYSSFCGSSLLMIDNFHFINPVSVLINVILVHLIFAIFFVCLFHLIITIAFKSSISSVIIEITYSLVDSLLSFFNQFTLFKIHFPSSMDIPNYIHLIYPLILIFLLPYLHRLWHKLLVLSCLPLTFLLVSMNIN
jgi:competence protein ComEC